MSRFHGSSMTRSLVFRASVFRASVYRIRYSDRRKFTRSCWFFELRLLKLVTL